MKLLEWQARSGPGSPAAFDYHPDRVKFVDGWTRFTLNSNKQSGGVMGPIVEPGVYTFDIRGRLDNHDPAVVFAIYTYDEATKDELDILEATRWGDPNQPHIYWQGEFVAGMRPVELLSRPARAFAMHRATFHVPPTGLGRWSDAVIHGVRLDYWQLDYWQTVAYYTAQQVNPIGHSLRMAFWLPKTGYVFKDTNSRGPRVIDVRATFEPLDADGDGSTVEAVAGGTVEQWRATYASLTGDGDGS